MKEANLKQFSALVERIYDAAFHPALWQEIPPRVAELQDSPQAILFALRLPGAKSDFHYSHGIDSQNLERWNAGAAADDIWLHGAVERQKIIPGNVVRGEELVDDNVFLNSPYYRDFLAPQDTRYLLSGVVFDGDAGDMPTSAMSVMRGHAATPFNDQEVELHRLITNHLSRAMGTMWRLRSKEFEIASTYAALDRLEGAVLLLGARGNVAFANSRARRIMAREDGLSLRSAAGGGGERLVIPQPDLQARYDTLVKSAVGPQRDLEARHLFHGIKVPRSEGEYVLQVSPLGQDNVFSSASTEHRAIVFITDTGAAPALDAKLLTSIYGLTPAEIRLAEALFAAESLGAIAKDLSISENTAKKHLQNIFAKTRTHRQSQLVRLLMSLRTER